MSVLKLPPTVESGRLVHRTRLTAEERSLLHSLPRWTLPAEVARELARVLAPDDAAAAAAAAATKLLWFLVHRAGAAGGCVLITP